MKIPGLIANKKDDDKLTSAQLQAKRDSFEAYIREWKPDPTVTVNSTANSAMNTVSNLSNQYIGGVDPYKDLYVNTPFGSSGVVYNQPKWEYYPPQNPGPFGGTGSLQTQDMARYLEEALKPKKSEFEVLLDAMFDTSEKEQFLITLGFEFTHEDGEDMISRTVAGLLEKGRKRDIFDRVFLREMTIKFKNLLISKNSLKMKLG